MPRGAAAAARKGLSAERLLLGDAATHCSAAHAPLALHKQARAPRKFRSPRAPSPAALHSCNAFSATRRASTLQRDCARDASRPRTLLASLLDQMAAAAAAPSAPTMFAYYMDDDTSTDQRAPHVREPRTPVSRAELAALGVVYWRMDAGVCVRRARAPRGSALR